MAAEVLNPTAAPSVATEARRLYEAGILTFPARAAAKHPDLGTDFPDEHGVVKPRWTAKYYLPNGWPTTEQHEAAFGHREAKRMFVVCGTRSGNVACLDFDQPGYFRKWANLIPDALDGHLYVEQSQGSGGFHVAFRLTEPVPSRVFARDPRKNDGTDGDVRIELRGEGAGFMAAPSGGYTWVNGDLADLPVLTAEGYQKLLDAATSFDECEPRPQAERKPPDIRADDADDRPGDRFNRENGQAEVLDLFEKNGWRIGRRGRGNVDITRPNATSERSGNVNPEGITYIFSTNTRFEADAGHRPFHAYATLEHGGNHSAAGKALSKIYNPPLRIKRRQQEGNPDMASTAQIDKAAPDAAPVPIREDMEAEFLPQIDAGNHNLPEVTQQAWDALVTQNDPPYLYQHGDVPTRLQGDTDGRIMLVPLTEHRLRCEVAQAADWHILKGKERQPVAAEPPRSVIQNMLAQATLPLPVLRQITETPVFAPDGRLIETAGYDATSGIYYRPAEGLTIPPVPARPTDDDIKNARTLICDDLLGDFPFTEQADLAAAVALNLLPYTRPMITGLTPMHGIESPTVGSGKGLLGDVLVRPAFGQHGCVIAEARDDDEWRKRIGAKLREGAPIIHIDNVTHPLDSGALAMALTAVSFSDRILGQTATFRATVRNIWMFTANNPTLSLEIARRTVRIRIDTNEEKPWQRDTFKHKNLRAWVDTRRGDLVHAALTLIRAWIVAGKPMADVTLGSYEEWAATMGGILDVAGVPGFLTNLDEFYEVADLKGAAWRQFVALWAGAHGSNKVSVGQLFELAGEVDGIDFGKGGDRSQRTSFGSQLTKQRDRIYDGYRITLAGEVNRAKQWRLLPVKSEGYEPRQQRFITDSPGIATDNEEAMNLCEPFSIPPAEKKLNQIDTYKPGATESEKVHRGSYGPALSLTPQGKTVMNLEAGGSPLADVPALHQWCVDISGGKGDGGLLPDNIRQGAQRHGFTFDPFIDVRREAARLEAHLAQAGRMAYYPDVTPPGTPPGGVSGLLSGVIVDDGDNQLASEDDNLFERQSGD